MGRELHRPANIADPPAEGEWDLACSEAYDDE